MIIINKLFMKILEKVILFIIYYFFSFNNVNANITDEVELNLII